MPLSKIIVGVGINLVVPFLGVVAFILFCQWMWKTRIQSPPFFSYFILFSIFGGWLMILLTGLFWEMSGMVSLAFIYLILIAPFATAVVAWCLRRRRTLSGFHRSAFITSIGYSILIPAIILILLLAHAMGLTGGFTSE
jgi:hypothetical protein